MFDLEYLDRKLQHHIIGTPPTNDFDDFCNYVLGDLLHDFVVEKKDDEIDTVEDPHYGLIYSEDGLYELFEFVIPLLEANRDKYENDGFY